MKKTLLLCSTICVLSTNVFGGSDYSFFDINNTTNFFQMLDKIENTTLKNLVQKNALTATNNTLTEDSSYSQSHFFGKRFFFNGSIPDELLKKISGVYMVISKDGTATNGIKIPVDTSKIEDGIVVNASQFMAGNYYYTQLVLKLSEDLYIPFSSTGNIYGQDGSYSTDAKLIFLSTLLNNSGYVGPNSYNEQDNTSYEIVLKEKIKKIGNIGEDATEKNISWLESLADRTMKLAIISTETQKKLVETVKSDEDFMSIIPQAKKIQFRIDMLNLITTVTQQIINSLNSQMIEAEVLK